jgi:single-strand DNA-binding protein
MPRGTLNKVHLIGILGKDPDIKIVGQSNMKMAAFTLATNEGYKDKQSGDFIDKAEWHRIICYNKVAELCEKYIKKGSKIYLEGKLSTTKYTDNSGIERLSTQVIMTKIEFLSAKKESNGNVKPNTNQHDDYNQSYDDDIPF